MSRLTRTPILKDGSFGLWERPPKFREFLPEKWIVREGDMLDLIAYEVYGRHDWWWVIAVANGIMNPLRELRPGKELLLPSPFEILAVLRNER